MVQITNNEGQQKGTERHRKAHRAKHVPGTRFSSPDSFEIASRPAGTDDERRTMSRAKDGRHDHSGDVRGVTEAVGGDKCPKVSELLGLPRTGYPERGNEKKIERALIKNG